MITGVYTITNIISNKMYVGSSTKDVNNRFWEHKNSLKKGSHYNRHLQRAWNKYGEDAFKFELLEEHGKSSCIGMEQYWITILDTSNPKIGYNICPIAGNSFGTKRTEEQKRNISRSKTGKPNKNTGKKHTPERILNMKISIMKSVSKTVSQYSLDDKHIRDFNSVNDAERSIGIKNSCIGRVCKGKQYSAYGFKWFYKDFPHNLTPSNGHNIKVYQYTHNGNFLKEYPSMKEAERLTGDNVKNIYDKNTIGKYSKQKYRWSKEKVNKLPELTIITHNRDKNGKFKKLS